MGNKSEKEKTKILVEKLIEKIMVFLNGQKEDSFNIFCSKIILKLLLSLISYSSDQQTLRIFSQLEQFGNIVFNLKNDHHENALSALDLSLNELIELMQEMFGNIKWNGQTISSTKDLIYCYNVK